MSRGMKIDPYLLGLALSLGILVGTLTYAVMRAMEATRIRSTIWPTARLLPPA